MRDNPFNQLIQFMREEGGYYNPPSILLAEVVNPSPLVIKIGDDLQIDRDNLRVADYLLANYTRQTSAGTITFTDTLQVGDTLAVIPTEDRQTFIVLCKVVDV